MITIIQDTRENKAHAWDFSIYGFNCIRKKLDTGDYSAVGYENMICIERKRSTGEISLNLGSKWSQFEAELIRMESFPLRYIVMEFPESDLEIFPENSGIPKAKWKYIRMSGNFIRSRLFAETSKRGIELIFSPSKEIAEQKVVEIIKNVCG